MLTIDSFVPNCMMVIVFQNQTGLTLEAGPLTVFESSMYIGETHLITTKPNERRSVDQYPHVEMYHISNSKFPRFLPFSMEFNILIQSEPQTNEVLDAHWARIADGLITLTKKRISKKVYTITNKSAKPIELMLEHPKEAQTTLVIQKFQIKSVAREGNFPNRPGN